MVRHAIAPRRLHAASVRTLLKHGRLSERGSGTMLGVTLVLVTLVMLSSAAAAGNVVVVRAQVRSAGDIVAVSAARSVQSATVSAASNPSYGAGSACELAGRVATMNGISLMSCTHDGADVTVEVSGNTSVPFIPTVTSTSRAGPQECG